jgi:hypothetical protein
MLEIIETLTVSVFCYPTHRYNYFLLAKTGQVLSADHTKEEIKYSGFFGGQSQIPIFVGMFEIQKDWFDWLPNSTKEEIDSKLQECVHRFGHLTFFEEKSRE